jgi:arginine:pyruvate transaminase
MAHPGAAGAVTGPTTHEERTMHFAPLVDRLAGKGAGAWAIHHDALRERAAGRDVIILTVGDPDQAPPAPVIEATVDALRRHRTGYSRISGSPELREAIAARFAKRRGVACAAENVTVVPGAQAGIFAVLQCLAGPGDEVIIPEPMYATYEAVTNATGARIVNVPMPSEGGFHPDVGAIARAVTPRTRVVWINSPHNPSGAVLRRDEVEAIAATCREHDLWLVSDEVYEDFAFAGPHLSPYALPGMAERTVVVSSLSKSHAIPGFRLGWVIGPTALTGHLFNLLLCMTYGGPTFIQDGALVAFTNELPEVAALHADYRRRAALLADLLGEAPLCRVIRPEGGMFVLLDVRGTGLGSEDFARTLLAREGVAALPCDGFGPSAVGHLRISLTEPDGLLEEAGRRIVRLARQLAQRNEA